MLVAMGFFCHATEWSDDFDGTLKPEWEWVREIPWDWSVNERVGFLRIVTQQGGLLSDLNNARNLLIREAPGEDYWIQTYVIFEPTEDRQVAGLLVYEDDDNFLLLGRAYCDSCGGNKICFEYEENGASLGGEWLTVPSHDCAYLKIVKEGATYSGYYKEEDTDWILVAEYRNVGIRPGGVGLAAFEGSRREGRLDADFAYFLLKENEGQPAATQPQAVQPLVAQPLVVQPPISAAVEIGGGTAPTGPVYASRVVECIRYTKQCDPESILGPPCGPSGAPRIDVIQNLLTWSGCWLGLCERGRVVVEMEWPFTDGPGADLHVYDFLADFEGGPVFADYFTVYVSADGEAWTRIGSDVAAKEGRPPIGYAAFDLANQPGTYRFVKVAVTMPFGAEPSDVTAHLGPELLAIEALYPVEP